MNGQSSLGIQLTDDALLLVGLKPTLKGFQVIGHVRHALITERPATERLAAVPEQVAAFKTHHGMANAATYLCVPGELTISRTVELPLAVRENLRETLSYEMEKFVPLPADSVYFDSVVLKLDKTADQLTALLVVSKKTNLHPYLALREALGGLSGIIAPAGALAQVVARLAQEQDAGPAQGFLHQDRHATTLGLIRDAALHYGKTIVHGHDPGETDRLLTTELAALHRLAAPADAPLPLWIAPPNGGDEPANTVGPSFTPLPMAPSRLELPGREFLPALGAALHGLGRDRNRINLLPKELRKKASRTGWYICFGLLLLTLVAGLAWGGGHLVRQRLLIDRLDEQLTRLRAEAETIEQTRTELAELEKKIDAVNALHGGAPLLDILQELTTIIPSTAWLRTFNYTNGKIQLDGFADSATALIPLLEESPLFEDVVFNAAITKNKENKEVFRINLTVSAARTPPKNAKE